MEEEEKGEVGETSGDCESRRRGEIEGGRGAVGESSAVTPIVVLNELSNKGGTDFDLVELGDKMRGISRFLSGEIKALIWSRFRGDSDGGRGAVGEVSVEIEHEGIVAKGSGGTLEMDPIDKDCCALPICWRSRIRGEITDCRGEGMVLVLENGVSGRMGTDLN